ncbi:unnamed protein product [Calypogeia fissa]
MEQEDHADGQITETSEQISEFPPLAKMEAEKRIVEKLHDMEQREKVLDAEEAVLNEDRSKINEASDKSLILDLLERTRIIGQARTALERDRTAAAERDRIAALEQAQIAALEKDQIEKITISSWLKQVMPRIPPIQLKTVKSKPRGGGQLYLSHAPQVFRRWISFKWETHEAKESFRYLEISEGIALEAEEPTLLQCLYYIIHMAIQERDRFNEFKPDLKQESSNEQQVESAGSPSSPEDDGECCPPDDSAADDDAVSRRQTRSDSRKKGKFHEETQLQLHEAQASDLHLDRLPFKSGGWSGNVVLGRVKGCEAVVKLAEKHSDRGKALLKEVRAYTKLVDYWGECVPKLVDYGTTAHGRLIFIATEFVKHNPQELFDEAIANAARKALRSIHVSGILHGDLHEGNILVTKGGLQFIDFGFAKFNPSKAECEEESELFEKVILKKKRTYTEFIEMAHRGGYKNSR